MWRFSHTLQTRAMSVQQTSIFVWHGHVKPKLSKRQSQVLATIDELGETCINEVADFLGTYPNNISGRFTELKEKGLIKKTDRKLMTNGHWADYYRRNNEWN